MISILLACGVLPVYAENDYGFTLTEKKLYLFPNSQSEISYSVEGDHTVSFEYSSGVDLDLTFEGNTVTARTVTGVGEYRVLIDDNQTENTIVFSVGPAPSQMGFSQETYYYKTGEGTIDSGLQLEPADSRYSYTSYAFEPAGILEVSEDDPHHFVMLGEGTVTVTASNTEFFDTASFIIKDRFLVESAESNETEYNIELNQTLDNQFIFNPDGAPYEDDVIHYESDNPDIVSVDRESGTATGLHFGDAVITAYGKNGNLGSYTVHVNGDPWSVDLDPSFNNNVRGRVGDLVTYTEEPTSISFAAGSEYADLKAGGRNIYVNLEPASASQSEITFESLNPGIADFSERTTREDHVWLNLYQEGDAVISATTSNGISTKITVHVVNGGLAESVSTDQSVYPVSINNTITVETEIKTSSGDLSNDQITYTAERSDIITINQIDENSIEITALKGGKSEVYAEGRMGRLGKFLIYVTDPELRFSFKEENKKALTGQELYLELNSLPEKYASETYRYTSSDPEVVEIIDQSDPFHGVTVKAKKEGWAIVSAYMGTYLGANIDVNVYSGEYAAGVQMKDGKYVHSIPTGKTLENPVEFLPIGGTFSSDTISYSTLNPEIVKVNADGTVEGLSPGTATVHAEASHYNGVSIEYTVNVYAEPENFEFARGSDSAVLGMGQKTIDLTFTPVENRNAPVTYTSDNPDVAYFENDQSTTGNNTLIINKAGTATLTAEYKDIKKEITLTVYDGDYYTSATLKDYGNLMVNQQMAVPVTFVAANGWGENDHKEYVVSDPSVIRINMNGNIIGLSPGTSDVSVYTTAGCLITFPVTVVPDSIKFENRYLYLLMNKEGFNPLEDADETLEVHYTSSDPDVVYIENEIQTGAGVHFRTVNAGNATVTATLPDSNISASMYVNVSDGTTVKSYRFEDNIREYSIHPGETLPNPIIFLPEGGTFEKEYFNWDSDDDTIASFDENGNLTGHKLGEVRVGCIAGSAAIRYQVYVVDEPTSITFNETNPMGVLAANQRILPITLYPESASRSEITYESSNPEVASVSRGSTNTNSVTLDLHKTGKTTITATSGSVSASVELTVTEGDYAIGVNAEMVYRMNPGETLANPVSLKSSTGSISQDTIRYTSTYPECASVDENTGDLTACRPGSTTISVYGVNGLIGTYYVLVLPPDNIYFENESITTVLNDEPLVIPVIIEPAVMQNMPITYESSDPNVIAIDTPEQSGGSVTARKVGIGTATIRTFTGGNYYSSVEVKVESGEYATGAYPTASVLNLEKGGNAGGMFVFTPQGGSFALDHFHYESDHPEIASVSEDGVITGVSDGQARISVSGQNGRLAELTVRVYSEPTKIEFEKTVNTGVLAKGTASVKLKFTPEFSYLDGFTVTSSHPEIAEINQDNSSEDTVCLTLKQTGSTEITVTAANGVHATATLEVVDGNYAISADLTNVPDVVDIGSTVPNNIIFNPDTGNGYGDDKFEYIVTTVEPAGKNPDDILTVDSSGQMTGVSYGVVKVRCIGKAGELGSFTVTVPDNPTELSFDEDRKVYLLDNGYTQQLNLNIYPETAAKCHINITASNDSVRILNSDARSGSFTIQIIRDCETVVRAEADNHVYDEITIRGLNGDYAYAAELKDNKDSIEMNRGETMDLPVEFKPHALPYEDDTFVFESQNTDVVTIDPNTGLLTAAGYGSSYITVSSEIGLLCSFNVYVPKPATKLYFSATSQNALLSDGTASINLMAEPYEASQGSVTYTSSDPSIASIDTSTYNKIGFSQVELHKTGTVTITAETPDHLIAKTVLNVIEGDYIEDLRVDPEYDSHVIVGETISSPVAAYPLGHLFKEDFISYRVEKQYEDCIRFNEDGSMTALKPGDFVVTAYTITGKVAYFGMCIYEEPTEIKLTQDTFYISSTDYGIGVGGMLEDMNQWYVPFTLSTDNASVVIPDPTSNNKSFERVSDGTAKVRISYAKNPAIYAECNIVCYTPEPATKVVIDEQITGNLGYQVVLRPEFEPVTSDSKFKIQLSNDNLEVTYLQPGMTILDCNKLGETIVTFTAEDGTVIGSTTVTVAEKETPFYKDEFKVVRSSGNDLIDVQPDGNVYTLMTGVEYWLEEKHYFHDQYFYMDPNKLELPERLRTTLSGQFEVTGVNMDCGSPGEIYLSDTEIAEYGWATTSTGVIPRTAGVVEVEALNGEIVVFRVIDSVSTSADVKADGSVDESLTNAVAENGNTLGVDLTEASKQIEIPSDIEVNDETQKVVAQTYMDVTIDSFTVNGDNTALMELHITPKGYLTLLGKDQENTAKGNRLTEPTTLNITETVEMRIPVGTTLDETGITDVYVTHVKEDGSSYVYKGTYADGYITFVNKHGFSDFNIFTENSSVGEIDDIGYTSFDALFSNVKDGDIVTIYSEEPYEAVVEGSFTFWIDDPKNVTIKAANGYVVRKEESAYTVSPAALKKIEAVPADCENDGNIEYWYEAITGKYYSDEACTAEINEEDTVIPALGHDYQTAWEWNEDYSSAVLLLTCTHNEEHNQRIEAAVTSTRVEPTETEDGSITYVASAEFNQVTYTDTKTVVLPKTGEDQKAESIVLEADTVSLNVGQTSVLTATVLPENTTDKTVTWSTDNEEVAAVDENGTVTAVSEGTATITVTSNSNPEVTAVCTVTVYSPLHTVEFVAGSLTLAGEIGVNFYLNIDDNDAERAIVHLLFRGEDHQYPASEAVKDSNGRRFQIKTAAKEMRDKILLYVTDSATGERVSLKVANGTTDYKETGYSYSVAAYLKQAKAMGDQNRKMADLAAAMDNYGMYSQKNFKYGNYAELTPDSVDEVTLETLNTYRLVRSADDTLPEGLTYYGSTLTLKAETSFSHYFILGDGHDISEYTFTLGETAVTPVKNGDYYVVKKANIAAKNLGDMTRLTVTGGERTYTIDYCPLSYGRTVLYGQDQYEEALQNTVKALYNYYIMSKKYFEQ